MLLSHNKDQQ